MANVNRDSPFTGRYHLKKAVHGPTFLGSALGYEKSQAHFSETGTAK